MNCLISGDWILPYQPLLLSASSAQSLNLMRWKLYSGTLIPLPWNCRPLPLWIRITVSWLPMAPPALFSALRLSHLQTTTVPQATLPTGYTACTWMLSLTWIRIPTWMRWSSPSAAKMNSVLSVISLTGTTFWMEEKMSISATAAIALITTWQTGTAFPVPYQGYPFQRTGRQF